jgi:hypothetical protein
MNGKIKIDLLFFSFFLSFLMDWNVQGLSEIERLGLSISGFRPPRRRNPSMKRRRVVVYLRLFRDLLDGRNGFDHVEMLNAKDRRPI